MTFICFYIARFSRSPTGDNRRTEYRRLGIPLFKLCIINYQTLNLDHLVNAFFVKNMQAGQHSAKMSFFDMIWAKDATIKNIINQNSYIGFGKSS